MEEKTPFDDNGFFLRVDGCIGYERIDGICFDGQPVRSLFDGALKLLGALVGLGRTVKEQLPKKADEEEDKEKVPESKESQVESGSKEDPEKKSPKKRWKFSWFEKRKGGRFAVWGRLASKRERSGHAVRDILFPKNQAKKTKQKRKTSHILKNLRKLPNLMMTRFSK